MLTYFPSLHPSFSPFILPTFYIFTPIFLYPLTIPPLVNASSLCQFLSSCYWPLIILSYLPLHSLWPCTHPFPQPILHPSISIPLNVYAIFFLFLPCLAHNLLWYSLKLCKIILFSSSLQQKLNGLSLHPFVALLNVLIVHVIFTQICFSHLTFVIPDDQLIYTSLHFVHISLSSCHPFIHLPLVFIQLITHTHMHSHHQHIKFYVSCSLYLHKLINKYN